MLLLIYLTIKKLLKNYYLEIYEKNTIHIIDDMLLFL